MSALLMLIEDMFQIKDRGWVATGTVSTGPIRIGDKVWVMVGNKNLNFTITEIQSTNSKLEQAEQGEHIGILLDGESADLLERGHVLCR